MLFSRRIAPDAVGPQTYQVQLLRRDYCKPRLSWAGARLLLVTVSVHYTQTTSVPVTTSDAWKHVSKKDWTPINWVTWRFILRDVSLFVVVDS
jgi:hypothetical protein